MLNESSIGTGARDYTTLVAWEAATDTNLLGPGDGEREWGVMYDDGDLATVNIIGAITDACHYRILSTAIGHEYDPVTDTGVVIKGTAYVVMLVDEDHTKIFGPMLIANNGTASVASVIVDAQGDNQYFSRLFGRIPNCPNSTVYGFSSVVSGANPHNVTWESCIAQGVGATTQGMRRGFSTYSSQLHTSFKYLNCLAINVGRTDTPDTYGFALTGSSASYDSMFNCIGVSSMTDGVVVGTSHTHAFFIGTGRISGGPIILSQTPGSTDPTGLPELFEDAASNDFRLKAGAAGADQGVSLAAQDSNFLTDFSVNASLPMAYTSFHRARTGLTSIGPYDSPTVVSEAPAVSNPTSEIADPWGNIDSDYIPGLMRGPGGDPGRPNDPTMNFLFPKGYKSARPPRK